MACQVSYLPLEKGCLFLQNFSTFDLRSLLQFFLVHRFSFMVNG